MCLPLVSAQGIKWLLTRLQLGPGKVQALRVGSRHWLRELEAAMAAGSTVVLEDVDDVLDPSLEPVLCKRVYAAGRKNYVKIGDRAVEFHLEFRLFLQVGIWMV